MQISYCISYVQLLQEENSCSWRLTHVHSSKGVCVCVCTFKTTHTLSKVLTWNKLFLFLFFFFRDNDSSSPLSWISTYCTLISCQCHQTDWRQGFEISAIKTSSQSLNLALTMFQRLNKLFVGEVNSSSNQEPEFSEKEDDEWILVDFIGKVFSAIEHHSKSGNSCISVLHK